MNKITKEILIEDLVDKIPKSVDYLMNKGIVCIRCGEPVWGTLESTAKEKGMEDEDIQNIVDKLNILLAK
ncbi:MAG: DUF1858 domain-containing protein [Bacteroidetes bacterium]|nr:DUF1858 domain-containing protein [Bacteroidota bacterium]